MIRQEKCKTEFLNIETTSDTGVDKSDTIDFDSTKYYLGKLCPKNHKWNESDKTLRRKGGKCPECERDRLKKYRENNAEKLAQHDRDRYYADRRKKLDACKRYAEANKEKISERQKSYYLSNREQVLERSRKIYHANREKELERHRKYYQLNLDSVRAKHRQYQRNNSEKIRIQQKRWIENNIDRVRLYWHRHQANKNRNHFPYTDKELQNHYKLFQYCCAYCGIDTTITMDHFIPVSKGGYDCINNIVPACKRCNSSKQASNPHRWYSRQPFFSEERWQYILKVLRINDLSLDF